MTRRCTALAAVALTIALFLVALDAGGSYAWQQTFKRAQQPAAKLVSLSNVKYGKDRKGKLFAPGETVWASLDLRNLKRTGDNYYLVQADYQVSFRGSEVERVLNFFDEPVPTGMGRTFRLYFPVAIRPDAPRGTYRVLVTIRDRVSSTYNIVPFAFIVR